MKTVRFLRPAEVELLGAAKYYELQAAGLGNEFLDKVDAALKDIREHPELCPIVKLNIRRRLVQRFPYVLLYRVDSDEIVIEATMHTKRRPDYWFVR
ncbi:MAG: type II toxin-antitoxin system RelE/ParE family toxin [Spartobacteria bacterium]|nr:type II toxin-antitoxin system RelE/ParE family toxin [Spartobacteria bacterium]